MDLTAPDAPLAGHIYLNDPTGETITFYKSTGTSYSSKPGGEQLQFTTPEGLIKYLASKPSLQKSANALSQTEMKFITDIAGSYGLSSTVDYIGPKATGTPYIGILDKSGQRVFTIRKLANKFFFNKIVYTPNAITGEAESILHGKDWNTLVKEMHTQFATFAQPTSTVSADDKLTGEETISVEAIVSKHSPTITYQPSGDAIVIWIGNHLTSYKVAKEQDVYRIYTDKDGEWVIQNQVNTYPELAAYLEDMLSHIAKALANSKLEQPLVKTEPSALFPDMLSPSEVAEVKKLVKKFKLPISTTYSKKLMETKGGPKENNAYNLVIVDEPHNVWIKINKEQGKYIISKGFKDAYFPLKKFDHFDYMLAYLDYFLNSYIKEEPTVIEKISNEEINLIKDLVKKYHSGPATVRRKYMTSKGHGKVPYVFIDTGGKDFMGFSLSKTDKGVYKLFKIVNGDWNIIIATDGWEGMYDILGKALQGEDVKNKEKYNPPVLNTDQFEWLETFMKTNKPGVEVKVWGNKVIGGYDPSNKINGESNPLFVIRFAPSGNGKIILQVQTEDGGMGSDEYPFNTFDALSQFIVNNLEVVTQLLKSETAPESKLAAVIDKAGFDYIDHKEIAQDAGGIKSGTIYENDKSERLYLYDDGISRIWYKNQADGETYKKEFGNIPELVSWMETHYAGKSSEELTKIKEYLAYLGFTTESKSDK